MCFRMNHIHWSIVLDFHKHMQIRRCQSEKLKEEKHFEFYACFKPMEVVVIQRNEMMRKDIGTKERIFICVENEDGGWPFHLEQCQCESSLYWTNTPSAISAGKLPQTDVISISRWKVCFVRVSYEYILLLSSNIFRVIIQMWYERAPHPGFYLFNIPRSVYLVEWFTCLINILFIRFRSHYLQWVGYAYMARSKATHFGRFKGYHFGECVRPLQYQFFHRK